MFSFTLPLMGRKIKGKTVKRLIHSKKSIADANLELSKSSRVDPCANKGSVILDIESLNKQVCLELGPTLSLLEEEAIAKAISGIPLNERKSGDFLVVLGNIPDNPPNGKKYTFLKQDNVLFSCKQ